MTVLDNGEPSQVAISQLSVGDMVMARTSPWFCLCEPEQRMSTASSHKHLGRAATDQHWHQGKTLPQMQAARNEGALAFSAVVNIPHSVRHGTYSFIRLHTTCAAVRCCWSLRL